MAWTTLAKAKTALGISLADTSKDTQLGQWISEGHQILVRECQQEIGNVVEGISAANPTVVAVRGHGYNTGDVISISGSNSTPTIDGQWTVTVVDQDSFTVPANVTVSPATATGWINVVFQNQYYSTDGTKIIALRQRPVLSIQSLYYDPNGYFGTPPSPATPFDSSTLMVSGTDYALVVDNDREQSSERGHITRINGYWPKPNERVRGILVSVPGAAQGNLKISYTAGRRFLPLDLQRASNLMVAISRATAARGLPMSQEGLDYYNYTLADDKQATAMVGSIYRILANYKEWRWGAGR